MAATRPKLWLTSRIRVINIITFLMLSAVAVADKGNSTQCYWCGPVAEQVHRKEIAPPCGTKNSVSTCQEGHNYCAIAATSPPYEESRFCTKVYQDECYPQYCNSTKKWRMTCTCRGDLCNENITKREMDAFTKLQREVEAKESREKRNTKTANFVPSNSEKTIIVTNLTAMQSDEENSNEKVNDHVTQLIVTDPKLNVKEVAKDEDVKSSPAAVESTESKNDDDSIEKEDKIKVNNNKNVISETPVKDVLLSKIVLGTTKMTKTKEAPVNTNTARPTEKLPTAEALQQEASSENDDNNTDHTTVDYEPTESGTSDGDDDDDDNDDDDKVTAEPGDDGESSGNINNIDIMLLLNGLLLHFIYNRK